MKRDLIDREAALETITDWSDVGKDINIFTVVKMIKAQPSVDHAELIEAIKAGFTNIPGLDIGSRALRDIRKYLDTFLPQQKSEEKSSLRERVIELEKRLNNHMNNHSSREEGDAE